MCFWQEKFGAREREIRMGPVSHTCDEVCETLVATDTVTLANLLVGRSADSKTVERVCAEILYGCVALV